MKKNKILAGLSALVMGATMMAGTAMSASAASVYNGQNYVGNGHFCTWNDANNNGVVDTGELTVITHADGLINGNVTVNVDGTAKITLQEMTYHGLTGEVTAIEDANGLPVTINSNNEVNLAFNTLYTLYIDFSGSHQGGNPTDVVFAIV
jgi:hypothetical protein